MIIPLQCLQHSTRPVNPSSSLLRRYFLFFFKWVSSFYGEWKCRFKSVDQRIGVSGIATAFRIISRFCLNRIWLEELNQLCPRITGMTLEESLESRGQSNDSFIRPCPSTEHLGVPVVQQNPSWSLGLSLCFLDIWTLNPYFILTVSRGYVLVPFWLSGLL